MVRNAWRIPQFRKRLKLNSSRFCGRFCGAVRSTVGIFTRLLDLGLSSRKTILFLYGIGAVAALLLLLASALHRKLTGLIVILFASAAWISIRHLYYAIRIFQGTKFRRIIDIETRTADFEAALIKATNMEDCWAAIRAGSQSFGFHEVRMSLCGRLFEDACSGPAKPRWQLRIQLPDSQWVNFYRDFDAQMNPLVLSAFAGAVQRGLAARSTAKTTELARIPPGSELYQAAAVGVGEPKRTAR